MKQVSLLFALVIFMGCSKDHNLASGADNTPGVSYTAQWNSGAADTFSVAVSEDKEIIYRNTVASGMPFFYWFNFFDTSGTDINTLQIYLPLYTSDIAVMNYHADSSTEAIDISSNGYFDAKATSQVMGKDSYFAYIKSKDDYFDLNITSIASDSLISGNFSCSMTVSRGVENAPLSGMPGGYVIKNGIFKNIKIQRGQDIPVLF